MPRNSVGSPQVLNGSLRTADLSKQAKNALRGARGARGLQGIPGARGPSGSQGVQGVQGGTGATGTGVDALFGNGLGGALTISTNSVLGTDAYFSDLTITNGAFLRTEGWRIFVSGTLTLNDGTAIHRDGNSSIGATPGGGLSPQTLGGAGGGTTTNGTTVTNSLGGNGGGAGSSSSALAGGGGGVVVVATTSSQPAGLTMSAAGGIFGSAQAGRTLWLN